MTYRVETSRSRVKNELKRIPRADLIRIGRTVDALASNPYPAGAVQLLQHVFRIRVGQYRIIYKVFDDERLVLVGRVVRRSETTYRDIETLFD